MSISRNSAALMAEDTSNILRSGFYVNSQGSQVLIGEVLREACEGTKEYPEGSVVPSPVRIDLDGAVEVANVTTTEAARNLHDQGFNPVALNFASARNPGGGFLSGARAQEESLCRASGLYACIAGREYYRVHREMRSTMYTSYAMYSPDVPVIRDESGQLLDESWPLSFITAAAPNAGALRQHGEFDEDAVIAAFEDRIRKVLSIGAGNDHDSIVLGAWGCGAFQNDPRVVAPLFAQILRDEFPTAYRKVVFAVLDGTKERRYIAPFERAFAR